MLASLSVQLLKNNNLKTRLENNFKLNISTSYETGQKANEETESQIKYFCIWGSTGNACLVQASGFIT